MPPSSEPQISSEEVKQKYIDILKANGIADEVEKVSMHEPEFLRGEHFAALSIYVKVDFKDPSKKSKNLFVKKFVDNELHRSMVEAMRIMEKESYFFTKFLPAARDFAKRYEGCENLLDFFPKCLYGDNDMVVLENVVLDDTFVMFSKEERQDLDTAKFVLNNLAKFHGVTYAMIQEMGCETFRSNNEILIFEAMMSNNNPFLVQMFDNGLSTAISILNSNPVEGGQETIETLSGYIGNAFEKVLKIVEHDPKGKMHVINHGDCWNNNMLFKRDSETGKVNDHLFIDLQITRMSSPNSDIAYFLFTSVKPEVRREHLKELLQHYFKSLQETLELFNKPCPLTFEEFLEDYKKQCLLGFLLNLNCMTAFGAMKDIDMTDMGTDPEKVMEVFSNAINAWVKKNPERSTEISTEIVASTKEMLELTSA